ncbi:MAG: penicillin acylase family protein [Balneolales bacterium]|nr:penicillin acylase family protein [Balneolales bacterium]
MNTILRLLLFFLILFIGFLGLAFYWTFYKPLPDYETTIEMPGLLEPVDIHWDDFGVPHIYAKSEQDLYYAFGYAQAQDRLWQMTIAQLAGEGRFAEFFGPELVQLDKYHRTLGFWRMANIIEDSIRNTPEYDVLVSFSQGVNDFVAQNGNRLPVQFALSGIEPLEWTPTHSLAVTRMMAWELNISWWGEVAYNYLKNKLPASQFEELRLSWMDGAPTTLDDTETIGLTTTALLPMLQQEIERRKWLEIEGSHVGSNAWVLDASKTTSGYPLLAGDPHLGLDMPGKWYEVHLSLNGKNVSGVSLPGVPGLVLGQNDELAWSFTSMMADDTDFFLEKVDPEDRGRYVTDSVAAGGVQFRSFDKEREIIKVKDADDQIHEIRFTKHGPVISDIYPAPELVDDHVISLQWTGYEFSNELKTMREMNWAQNFQEYRQAISHYGVPGMNFMYGDRQGNIGMFSTAKLPIRSGDHVTLRRGWVPEDDWQGFIPFEEMPHVINPEKGWIANANNKITTDNYPYYIASFWHPPSRMKRIVEVLNSKDQFMMEDMIDLQNDTYSHFAATMTPLLVDIINAQNEYDFSIAVSYLENWDFKYETSSTAASIFDIFFQKFTENTLKDEFGEAAYQHFVIHELIPVRTMTELIQDSSSFFDNIFTPETESREEIVLKSMQDAILFLSDSLGIEPFEWRWEQLHTITFKPPLFSVAAEAPDAPAPLKLIVDNMLSKGPYPVAGHGMSVNSGQYKWHEPFEMTLGPSVRRIVDLSNLSYTRSVLSTGQSGNPLSTHYGDQTTLWLNKQYRNFYQDSTFFTNADFKTMRLIPSE